MVSRILAAGLLLTAAAHAGSADFKAKYCTGCHNGTAIAGGLDLTTLVIEPVNPANFAEWVKVHDRLRAGEMPPKAVAKRPDPREQEAFLRDLAASLAAVESKAAAAMGRATERRLNAYEYENALRDLFH